MYDCNFTHRNLILNLLLQSTRPVMINSFSDERRNQFFIYHILPNKEWARRKQEKNLSIWFCELPAPKEQTAHTSIFLFARSCYNEWRAVRSGRGEFGGSIVFFLYFIRKTNSQSWRLLQGGGRTRDGLRHFVGGPLGGVSCFCFRFFVWRQWHC